MIYCRVFSSLRVSLSGVRMSNFRSREDNQTELQAGKRWSERHEQNRCETLGSFFDQVEKEKKNARCDEDTRPTPLGLLAYMTDEDRTAIRGVHTGQSGRTSSSLDKFSVRRRDIWDDLESPGKAATSATSTKTLWNLLDSGCEPDPWRGVGNGPSASTPHHKKAKKGPLDLYSNCPAVDLWSVDSESSVGSTSDVVRRHFRHGVKQANHRSAPVRPVESYFTKTKSVWSDLECSNDSDVICVSENRPSRKEKSVVNKPKRGRRGRKVASHSTRSSYRLPALFDTEINIINLRDDRPTKPRQAAEVVVIDSD